MNAKEFLKRYEYADRRVKRIEQEYAKEMELIDSVKSTADIDGLPHGTGISKKVEDRAVKLADKAMELAEARMDAVEERQQVFEIVNQVDGINGDILFERYINLHKWEEICVIKDYSWNGVHKIHRAALSTVDEILNRV